MATEVIIFLLTPNVYKVALGSSFRIVLSSLLMIPTYEESGYSNDSSTTGA